ncbi:hypothetical protein BDZ89DRAFT_1025233 [Hymenopellis radicata]|nr:hypothetical protein BDZ89DRAFT_1025233 [Hymenopellis radicata]
MPKAETGFYAVRVGRETGIFDTWERCEASISRFPGNQHKKLPTRAQAEQWLQYGSISAPPTSTPKPVSSTSKSASTATNSKLASTSKPASSSNSAVKQATVAPSSTSSFNAFARAQSDPPASGEVTVFSDGACKGNGKVGSVAGVGVWWGHDDPRNLAERCPGKQTNNRAELIGIVRVLEQCKDKTHAVRVKTDSKYSMKCVTEWLPKWQLNGFRTSNGSPVENASLIRYLAKLLERSTIFGRKVKLEYVKGHAGIEGNEMADLMANRGATLPVEEERDWEMLAKIVDDEIQEELQRRQAPVVNRGTSNLSAEVLLELAALNDDFEVSD